MSDALTRDEGDAGRDIEDLIADYQKARGPQSNMSFFAFTATPRNVTLERFGIKGPNRLPQPFHLYSMRQAIEEGFILDVLQNYMTYKAYYQLEKAIEDDPELNGRRGQRRVARFASLHPTAIGQKVEVIVEHFRRHVITELDGQAKAMIVTGSREHALRYYFGVRDYIKVNGYKDVKALVAFSGDLELDGEKYTEAQVNGFSETELPKKFDKDATRFLSSPRNTRPASINQSCAPCTWSANSQAFRRCRRSRASTGPIPARTAPLSSIFRTPLRTCRTLFL
jgi:type I restriction enzyme R subunit